MTDTTLPDLLRAHDDGLRADADVRAGDDVDDFVLPPSRGRMPKLTIAIGGLAVLAAGFLGGALIQKHEGSAGTADVPATRAGRLRAAGGFAGFGGAAGAGTGAAGGAAALPGAPAGVANSTGAAGAATGTTGATAPIAIGTVVSVRGSTLVVKDLGGHLRTITVGSGATVTQSAPLTATSLKDGDAVTVSGTTAGNGTTTATTVLRRRTN